MNAVTATRQAPARASGRTAMASHERAAEPACLTLAADPTAPHQARHFATRALRRWQIPAEVIGSAQTIVTELVTNSWQAYLAPDPDAGQPGLPAPRASDRICLALWRQPGQVVIEVSDHHPKLPVIRDAGASAERGRGLLIVQALSQRWGYRRQPSGGKVVYAVIPTRTTEGSQ